MPTLSQTPTRVQPTLAELAAGWNPDHEDEIEDTGPTFRLDAYEPTPAESAFWLAFNAANDGEPAECPRFRGPDSPEVTHAFCLGTRTGTIARESRAAKELGHACGLDYGHRVPPGGYEDHEASAFALGCLEGVAEDEARTEVMIELRESAWLEDHHRASDPFADTSSYGLN